MDAGRRSVSLRALAKLAGLLHCSLGELLETVVEPSRPLFHQLSLNDRVLKWDERAENGQEKGWVHTVQLAWLRHYGRRRRRS
jgi:hypothetical protein